MDPATEARINALDLSMKEGRAKFLRFNQELFGRQAQSTNGGTQTEPVPETATEVQQFREMTVA